MTCSNPCWRLVIEKLEIEFFAQNEATWLQLIYPNLTFAAAPLQETYKLVFCFQPNTSGKEK